MKTHWAQAARRPGGGMRMNRTQYLAGLVLLGVALVGSWAALAPAQSNDNKPATEPQPAEVAPAQTPAPAANPTLPEVVPPAGAPVVGTQPPVSVLHPQA